METQWVIFMEDITAVQYICPECKKRFVRSLEELGDWYKKADPNLGDRAIPLCPFCGKGKEPVDDYREIHGVIGNVVNLWSSPRSKDIKLRFVISAKRDVGEE